MNHDRLLVRGGLALMIGLLAMLGSGCATKMPAYSASPDNVRALRDAPVQALRLGAFTSDAGNPNSASVGIRATSLAPEDGDFAAYLRQVARADLSAAGKLSESSSRVLAATLLRTTVDASGFSVGTSEHVARFTLDVDGKRVYEREHRVDGKWDSSFIGAIAIPMAATNFTAGFQALMRKLYEDPAFQQQAR